MSVFRDIPVISMLCSIDKLELDFSLDYVYFRILTKLLEVSDDPQVLAVAAHDVGHYPRGNG